MISGPVVYSWANGLLTCAKTSQVAARFEQPEPRTLVYWSRMIPYGISRCSLLATPAIVKEFSHERPRWVFYALPMWLVAESQAASVGVRTTSAPNARRVASFSYKGCQGKCYDGTWDGTHKRHLIRQGDDHRISLIYSIQYPSMGSGIGRVTLIAHAIARPIPEWKC